MNAAARRERATAVIDRLAVLWPKCFAVFERRRRPLAIGVDKELIELRAPAIKSGMITALDIKRALQRYAVADGYLFACRKAGVVRINLNGNLAGVVTEAEAERARKLLDERRQRKAAKAASPTPQNEISRQKATAADQLKHGDVVRCVPQKAQPRGGA